MGSGRIDFRISKFPWVPEFVLELGFRVIINLRGKVYNLCLPHHRLLVVSDTTGVHSCSDITISNYHRDHDVV